MMYCCTLRVSNYYIEQNITEEMRLNIFYLNHIFGSYLSCTHKQLFISDTPVEILQPLKEIEAIEGDTVTLECQMSRADLPATWLKDGKSLPKNDRYTITTDGTYHRLTIKNCSLDEEAEYTVQVASLSSKSTVWVEGMNSLKYFIEV